MVEFLTTQLVSEELQRLVVAFPGNLAAKSNPGMLADTYRAGLQGVEGDAVRAAVTIIIREDSYFPKIARIREVAGEWSRRNRAHYAANIEAAWHTCPICGASAQPETITRPKLHEKDTDAPYYLTTAGQKVMPRDLIDQQSRGVPLVTETVEGRRLVMSHRPGPHHVHAGEVDEYREGVA